MDLGRHIAYMKTLDPQNLPGDFPARLAEAIEDVQRQTTNIEQQGNFNALGTPKAPPQPNSVSVTGQNGFLHVAIQDNNEVYRGVHYFAEHADNPAFTNAQVVHMGASRNAQIPVGSQSRYVRVYSSYPSSSPSQPLYHGGAQPIAVNGGGSDSGPAYSSAQGSGTGTPGQAVSGFGPIAFRTSTGGPPTR